MKKKKIILGIVATSVLVAGVVIPIVIINNNDDKKDKEDVEAVIKILKSKTLNERTIELDNKSNGKIVADNKKVIIDKIKKLINTSKLRGVSIEISMKVDSNISILEQAIIVKIKKGEYSKKLEGNNGLKIKRAKNIRELKIDSIQKYLENLSILLPKFNYNNDIEILNAIRKKIIDEITIIENNDSDLITKKEDENNVTSVANHSETATLYIITVGEEDFTLKLNQDEFSEDEKNIKIIKDKIKNKDLTLIAATNTRTDEEILVAIKAQLQKDNSNLSEDDLEKITDDITTLIPGTRTAVTLTITAGTQTSVVNIHVTRPKTTAESNIEEIENIKSKITDKDLTLLAATDTSDDGKILVAIKAQLKIDNKLSDEDLEKITDDITTLIPGTRTAVTLTITAGTQTSVVNIHVTRPKTTAESNIEEIENIKSKITDKDLTLLAATDTSDDGKILVAIKAQLQKDNSNLSEDDLEKITDDITTLIPGTRTAVTLTITAGTQTSVVNIHVTRPKTTAESNIEEIENIKSKITDKDLTLLAATDTSDDGKILAAIKVQLQKDNSNLSEDDLEKITDDITTLIPGTRTEVTLTITAGTQTSVVNIHVTRPKTTAESNIEEIENIKSKITNKDINLLAATDTSNDAKILAAIKAQLKIDNKLSDEDLEKITDDITTLIPGTRTEVTLTITAGTQTSVVNIHVTRPKNTAESNIEEIENIKSKITDKDLALLAATDTSDDGKILVAIKAQLQKDNSNLSEDDLEKITDDITTLIPGTRTAVTLTITAGTQTSVVNIHVTRPKNTAESNIEEIENIKSKITDKDLTLLAATDTSDDGKILVAIKAQLQKDNSNLSEDDLEKITDDITTLIPGTRTAVTLTITAGTQTSVVNIHVTRPKTIAESNIEEIENIKSKITDKDLTLLATIDTSDDGKILAAIKAQLQKDNSNLSEDDLEKITDDITTLIPGTRTAVTLTITAGTQTSVVNIHVTKLKNPQELIDEVHEKINNKQTPVTLPSDDYDISKEEVKNEILTKIANIFGLNNTQKEYLNITTNSGILVEETYTPISITITLSGGTPKIATFKIKKGNPINRWKDSITFLEWKNAMKNITNTSLNNIEKYAKVVDFMVELGVMPHGNISKNYPKKKIFNLSKDSSMKHILDSSKEEELNTWEKFLAKLIIINPYWNNDSHFYWEIKEALTQLFSDIEPIKHPVEKVKIIKDKIIDKHITLLAEVDTSDDAKILVAIKDQLKIDNNKLSDEDLEKITDSINTLTPGIRTTVTLTITVRTQFDTINIDVLRPKNINELNQDDVNGIKKLLNALTSKEITIDESSGSITTNKDSILGKLQTLSGYPSDLKGVSLSIKDSSDSITLEGIAFIIELSKGSVVNQELIGFTVKRSQSQDEIQSDINEIKNSLNALTSKEVTIDETSGSITTHKNSILEKLQALSGYPSDLKGVSLSIKDSSDSITLEGIAFIIELSKGSVVNQELIGFTVKRSQSQDEIQSDINEIKNSLNALTSKEVTIDETSGSITTHKNSILGKLQALSGYPSDLKGVSLSIKDSSDSITLEGIAFIIELSKGSVVNQELIGFTVKRSQSQAEIDQNDVDEIKNSLNALTSKEVTIDETSGSITTHKNSILEKLQALSGYPSDLKGVSLSIKDSSDSITLEGIAFIIELSKGSVVNQELIGFTVKRSQSQAEIDQNDVDEIKNSLNALTSKEVTIDEISGSITTHKNSIFGKLQALSGYPSDLKGVSLSIKDSSDSITLEGIAFIIELSKGSVVNQELIGFTVKRSQSQAEIDQNDVDEIKNSLNALTSKEVTIDETSGSITTHKNSILEKLQALSGYPSDLKGVSLSIKDSSDSITLEGIAFIIELSKGSVVNQELIGFTVKRSQSQAEIDQNDVDEIKNSLNALTSKEVTIDESSGSITTNKNSILGKLQALSGYPSDLKGVSLSIKDSSDSITLEGIAFIIELSKGSVVNQELIGFTVKRSKTDIEKVNEIKKKIESSIIALSENTDTSTSEKTLNLIKKEMKNLLLLTTDEIEKITFNDGITFDEEKDVNDYNLTVQINEASIVATLKIQKILVPKDFAEQWVREIIEKIANREININNDVDTSTNEKILLAIKNQLKKDIPSLTEENLNAMVSIDVTSLTPGSKTLISMKIIISPSIEKTNIYVTKSI